MKSIRLNKHFNLTQSFEYNVNRIYKSFTQSKFVESNADAVILKLSTDENKLVHYDKCIEEFVNKVLVRQLKEKGYL